MDLLLILGEKWNSCSQQSALPYTVACCCRNPRAKRFLSSRAAIFEASVTFHVQTGLCLGHMICYTPNSWCQELSSSDFWHRPSLNTLHCALHYLEFLFFLSLSSLSHSLFCFLSLSLCFSPLCSSSAIWLTAEADSDMEGIRWFQLEKLHSFCILLWTLLLSSCLFYSNTLKQKDWDGETFAQSVSGPTALHF